MPVQSVIAIILDCDGTLCADSTEFLLNHEGLDSPSFWSEVDHMVRNGWDPSQAYMHLLIKLNRDGKTRHRLTPQHLAQVGSEMTFYNGVPEFFHELKQFASEDETMVRAGAELEFYVISCGFEDVIRGSKIAKHLSGIAGCTFEIDEKSEIAFPKRVITFTEKTKYLFAINKGIQFDHMRQDPYSVNDAVVEEDRIVPFHNMIYVGDGPSDIPCLSTVKKLRGKNIGVYGPGAHFKAYQLARGERITVGPYEADYRPRSNLRNMLDGMMLELAWEITQRMEEKRVPQPSFDAGKPTKQ